jgi:hypothetical protein
MADAIEDEEITRTLAERKVIIVDANLLIHAAGQGGIRWP